MSKTKKFEDFNTEKVNENLEDITNEVNGITVYGDGEELELNFSTIKEVKKWIIENQMNFGEIMVIDEDGDSVTVSKEDTLEDIELLFSDIDNVEMEEEDCGCSSNTREYEEGSAEYEEYEEYPTNDLAPKFDTVIESEEEYEEDSITDFGEGDITDFETKEDSITELEEYSVIGEFEEKVTKKFNVIKKKVDEINELIAKAIDKDGDKIEVIDPKSTWEEPMYYEPVSFVNNVLTITYTEPYSSKKQANTETIDLNVYLEDIEENHFMLEDAKGDLAYIKRMYNKAIKKAIKEGNLAEDINSVPKIGTVIENEEESGAEEFISDDKYYADYMDIAQFHPDTPIAITTGEDSYELEKLGKKIVDTQYGGDVMKAYDAVVSNDNILRWEEAYRKILAIQREAEAGNITEETTDLVNTNERKIVKFDTYFKK